VERWAVILEDKIMGRLSNSDVSVVIGVQEYPRRISNNRLTFDCCEMVG
jgi:hypothetical protein